MPSQKYKAKLMKHRICSISRIMACASFLMLAIIGVSSLVRAMSLENIANEKGVPTSWDVASLGNPETITVPITYWDQRQDPCSSTAERQFEWSQCQLYSSGVVSGIVKNHLGTDGLPIPAFSDPNEAWNKNLDIFTKYVTGHDPVQPNDNFYRWFHETAVSKRYDREVTFTRTGTNTYKYGSRGTFPLDKVDFSKDDEATATGHNFHFTSHLRIPIKIAADGTERFDFLGDDDVWVFLNGQLVLDIGGLHEAIKGHFTIGADGKVTSFVEKVNDTSVRTSLRDPFSWSSKYSEELKELNGQTYKDTTTTVNLGLKAGDVVNLDFFYAERSTSESNTEITISNMNWPISADSEVEAEVVGKVETTENNLVKFNTSITNRDIDNPLNIERLAAYIKEEAGDNSQSGFLPLSSSTLYYTTTPNDADSWKPVDISAPANDASGFNLKTSIRLAPYGQSGDTAYFRYFGESIASSGKMTSLVSYYTTLNGVTGFTYDYDTVTYKPAQPTEYNVNIKYIYADDETQAHAPYTKKFTPGTDFSVPSPIIEGYTADIITVKGTVTDGDLNYVVKYTKTPEEIVDPDPETRTITIHYIYEDGTKAADDYKEDFKPGDDFSVDSPFIKGYTPDQPNIYGTVGNEDQEFIVRYKKPVTPVAPVTPPTTPPTPVEPTNPVTPDTPDTPTIPDDLPVLPLIPNDSLDGDLVYLAPLGEVAFVPSTGVINTSAASVFEQQFADVILSQGVVMGLLFIFAASFAAYFSFRRCLKKNAAPATAGMGRTVNLMTKSPKKVIKRAKATTKTSRTTAKTTAKAKTAKATRATKKSR